MPNPLSLEGVMLHLPETPHRPPTPHPDTLRFITLLHRTFDARRRALLQLRDTHPPGELLLETQHIREHNTWTCTDSPPITTTGNSSHVIRLQGLDNASAPTWHTVMHTHAQWADEKGNSCSAPSTLVPRALHTHEQHMTVDGAPVSAALFDFALHFHATHPPRATPHYCIQGLVHHGEARLWHDVLCVAEDVARVPRGSLRVALCLDTPAALWQCEEMLFELRQHCAVVLLPREVPGDTARAQRLHAVRAVCARRCVRVLQFSRELPRDAAPTPAPPPQRENKRAPRPALLQHAGRL
ncbi:hypothetical protein DAKH74_005210 [Maudiozyma humilis]|uniref:malate synthase n=1 Tax=Maudiozyma humilis TaxID=51915 RepID=A0AAV5RQX4_MAUHU|nr:hypothetical protein DAKH74_005210 [Kazachstania humilis]